MHPNDGNDIGRRYDPTQEGRRRPEAWRVRILALAQDPHVPNGGDDHHEIIEELRQHCLNWFLPVRVLPNLPPEEWNSYVPMWLQRQPADRDRLTLPTFLYKRYTIVLVDCPLEGHHQWRDNDRDVRERWLNQLLKQLSRPSDKRLPSQGGLRDSFGRPSNPHWRAAEWINDPFNEADADDSLDDVLSNI